MKNLFKSSILLGTTELALVIISIIRSKYLATHIGPEGLGLYSILNSFFLLITAFCGGWFGQAYIKFVAEYHKDQRQDRIQVIHNFSFTITCIVIPIVIVVLFIFKSHIIDLFLAKEILDFHYAIFASLFIVNSIKSIYGYYLNATLLFKETAKTKFLTTIFELVSILILVYLFSVTGFFISILLSALTSLIIYIVVTRKYIKTKFDLETFGNTHSNSIIKFGSINIILLFLNNTSQYLYRFFVLNSLNVAFVGLFQATTSLINYLGIINRGADFTYIPTMSQNLSIAERNKTLNDYLKFNIVTGVLICSIAILFCKEIVMIFYTKEFDKLSSFFYVFVIGQFLSALVVSLQGIITGTNNYKIHSIVVVGTNLIWIIVPYFLIQKLGILSIGLGIIIASIWSILFNYIYLWNKFGIQISKQVVWNLLLSFLFITLSVISSQFNIFIKLLLLLIEGIFLIAISENEHRKRIFQIPIIAKIHRNILAVYTFLKWNT